MTTRLTVTVLTENAPTEGLLSEHGLAIHLRYQQARRTTTLLLDFGQTDAFAHNATTLGIDLSAVDLAVLSHAHYDHADGMPAFFAANGRAPLYLSEACGEDCWSTKAGTTEPHYIGIGHGLLARYAGRLARVATGTVTTIAQGVHLVPHTTPGLAEVGERAGMLRASGKALLADDFAHEVSLVLELAPSHDGTPRLAVFNSCSHAGLPVILAEVQRAFPDAHVYAYVGGLHLVHASNEQVLQVAEAVSTAGVERLCTGHCTGEPAFDQLQSALPGRIHDLHPGKILLL
ncbi:MAG: MBL fold metallo-hydrolase [Atopobiaceae bacterium]|nr:MBL fold metallo-hydrolase [Atopobiaceae bacterium]